MSNFGLMLVVLLQTSSYCVLSRDLFKRLTDFSTRCLCFLSVQGSIGRFLEIWRNRASARRMGVAHSVLCSERVRRRSLLPRLRKDSVARLSERPRAGCARGRACGLSWPLTWQRLGNTRSACRVWRRLPSRIFAKFGADTPNFRKIRGIFSESGARITTVFALRMSGFLS